AGKAAAEEEPRATLQSPLILTVAAVVVVVVGYALMSTCEVVVGAAAGAAAGVCILKLLWEEEERKGPVGVAVTAIAGGVAGAAAAKLRSMIGAQSLIGSAIVGAIAGAAIVAIAKKLLQRVINAIQWLKDNFKSCVVIALGAMGGMLLTCVKNTIKLITDQIKWAVAKVKPALQWIKEAAIKLFNTLASMVSGLPAIAAAAVLGLAASAAVSGLASGLFGGLLVLALVVALGSAIFGSHTNEQSQAKDVVLPIAVLLLFVLFCFLVTSLGVLRFCGLLLFLSLALWFLLRYCSDRN
ncbi:hypothetical protein PO909_032571, partial [Leuciscus waleckii]